jgi:hypothetical protein
MRGGILRAMRSGVEVAAAFAVAIGFGFGGAAAVTGCGLPRGGLGPEGAPDAGAITETPDASSPAEGSGAASPEDAASDAGEGSDTAGPRCPTSIPAGWSLALYEPSRAPCPPGAAAHDVVQDPQASDGACSCACTITSPPSCTDGSLEPRAGEQSGSGCPTHVSPVAVSGGGCAPLPKGLSVAAEVAFPPVAMTGGRCVGTAVGHLAETTATQARTCDVPPERMETVCAGSAPAGFDACIATDGDAPCPPGTPFTRRTVVAASELLVCSACTGCSVGGECSGAQVTLFHDRKCKQVATTLRADGTCGDPGFEGPVGAVEYEAQPAATCSAEGSQPTFEPVGPRAICCR